MLLLLNNIMFCISADLLQINGGTWPTFSTVHFVIAISFSIVRVIVITFISIRICHYSLCRRQPSAGDVLDVRGNCPRETSAGDVRGRRPRETFVEDVRSTRPRKTSAEGVCRRRPRQRSAVHGRTS